MTRFFLTTLLSLYAFIGYAQLSGNNYYRFQNVGSQRYLYIKDYRGSVSIGSTSADLGALHLWKDFELTVSDPSSIVYVTNVSGNEYRFHSQGTNSYDIVGYDLRIIENSRLKGTYSAYQTKNNLTSYLCDENTTSRAYGLMGTNVPSNKKYKYWNILPVNTTDNYFGLTPEVKVGSDYYAAFYAEFPATFVPSGMKTYYVNKVERGMAVIQEVKGNAIPAATPVIVKCVSERADGNKLSLQSSSIAKPSGNLLSAVYFCNDVRGSHRNVTVYNPETMRFLGTSTDGKLVFKKADVQFVPANKAYLNVPAGSPDEILVVTQKQYDDIVAAGIDGVLSDSMQDERIFNMSGVQVGKGMSQIKRLPAGVYMMAGKKYIVK